MSLKKIASLVGTSPSTVSRVLNNTSSTCASKELQEKIWKAARDTGYCPNESARQLRKNTKMTQNVSHISVVLARITNLDEDPFFYELFHNLEIELFQQGTLIDQVIYAEESLTYNLSSDGVIILGRCSQKLLDHILQQTKNVVGIWRNSMNFNVDEVVCDGKRAAELAMKHLLALGHKSIAYIGDCSFESRYIGYCDMLIKNDIPMNYNLIKQTDQTAASGYLAVSQLLTQEIPFSAIFCANDITAISVLNFLKENRRQIKRKISVISIDNIEESQNTSPFLTTIHIPRAEMAHMAVQLLLDRIQKKHTEIIRIEFPCRIIQRDSCHTPD